MKLENRARLQKRRCMQNFSACLSRGGCRIKANVSITTLYAAKLGEIGRNATGIIGSIRHRGMAWLYCNLLPMRAILLTRGQRNSQLKR